MRIDSHQHFWKYNPVKDAWITENMKVIQRDFLPSDLQPLLNETKIDGCVAIQADQSEEETHFLLQLAESNDFIKGVVGWVDLRGENVASSLGNFSQFKKLKGFRHIVQGEKEDDFLLRYDFCNGIAQLEKYNFTYDLLIFPKHLAVAYKFAQKFPKQKMVIDHLAKPNFKEADFANWEQGIRAIATCQNVYCKVSGLVTEADWNNWTESDFNHCLDVITEAFGIERLMFGSDWPVTLLAATYNQSYGIVRNYFSKFSPEEQDMIWGKNAVTFYNL